MLRTSLLPLLYLPAALVATQVPLGSSSKFTKPNPIALQLRHLHAATDTGRVVFADVPSVLSRNAANDPQNDPLVQYILETSMRITHRPSSYAAHVQTCKSARLHSLHHMNESLGELSWDEEEIIGPDVTSRETLQQLAKMTNNAYAYSNESYWYDLGGDWNDSYPFGWEEDADGFRGHVFTSTDNTTAVISIKGTSSPFVGSGGPTVAKDKLNNNLLFSCCCAKVGFSWSPVCGCWAGGWKCDRNCLQGSVIEESLYYSIGTNLYNNVSYMYPEANIWVIGHSLGGSLASLIGVTFGTPVVAFEAPGEKMAAERLHLPSPPSTQHITHVYHNADPVPMGTCTGVFSTCAIAGYALESRCHLGNAIVYDTVTELNWGVSIRSHSINVIVEQLLDKDWNSKSSSKNGTNGPAVPIAKPEEDCVECYEWEYGDFLDPGNWLRAAEEMGTCPTVEH